MGKVSLVVVQRHSELCARTCLWVPVSPVSAQSHAGECRRSRNDSPRNRAALSSRNGTGVTGEGGCSRGNFISYEDFNDKSTCVCFSQSITRIPTQLRCMRARECEGLPGLLGSCAQRDLRAGVGGGCSRDCSEPWVLLTRLGRRKACSDERKRQG